MNFIPLLAVFGFDDLIYIALALSTVASTYASYSAAQTQAKQSELNAKAQADALGAEAQQKAAESAEAARRKALEQRRFRSTQLAEISGQGIQLTGTPLDILANTAVQQQQELSDVAYGRDMEQRSLAYQGQNALALGSQQSAAAKSQAGATLLSGASSLVGVGANYSSRPQTAATNTNYAIPAGYKPRPASQRPAGY
jgi:hypothetical protein